MIKLNPNQINDRIHNDADRRKHKRVEKPFIQVTKRD